MAEADILEVIDRTVRQRIAHDKVLQVDVRRDHDHDGEEALEVIIVLDDSVRLGRGVLPRIINDLRNSLVSHGEMAFPFVRILKKKDFDYVMHGARLMHGTF